MKKKKFNLSGIVALAISLLVLVVFVPVNLIVSYYDKVYDMTPAKQYTLNDKTVELLDSNSDKEIEVYFMLDSLKTVKDNPDYLALYHTLDELDKRSNITLECFEPDEEPERAKALDASGTLGVERGDVFVKCGDITKRVSHSKIYQSADAEGTRVEYAGEELIASAIMACTSGSLKTMYYLTGHGEKKLDEAYIGYANTVKSDNYDFKELDLNETGVIPGNVAALYLVGPQQDITDKEYDIISAFLDNGGSMSMLLGPSETPGRFRNIEKILKTYGIEMDYDIVSETNPSNQLSDHSDTQNPNYMRVSFPEFDSDSQTQDLTTDINTVINSGRSIAGIFNTRSFAQLPEDQYDSEKIEVGSLMTNIPDANSKSTTKCTPMGGDETTAEFVETELEGLRLDYGFYSYNKVSGAKLFVLGSNDIINPDYLPSQSVASTTLTIFSNTWLYDNDIEMGIGNKATAYDYMEFKDEKEAKHVMALTAILPVAILIFGILVWIKRRHA